MAGSADLLRRITRWVAGAARRLADIADPEGSYLALTPATFTFEDRVGLVLRGDGHGCRLWYRAGDYEQAHDAKGPPGAGVVVWMPQDWPAGSAWPPPAYTAHPSRKVVQLRSRPGRNGNGTALP